MKRRVVVTGMGIISPLGYGLNETGRRSPKAVREWASSASLIPAPFSVKIAGEVKGFTPEDHINHKDVKKRIPLSIMPW